MKKVWITIILLGVLGVLVLAGGILLTLSGYDVFSGSSDSEKIRNSTMIMAGFGIAGMGLVMLFFLFYVVNFDSYEIDEKVWFFVLIISLLALVWGTVLILDGYGIFIEQIDRVRNKTMIIIGFICAIGGLIMSILLGLMLSDTSDMGSLYDGH